MTVVQQLLLLRHLQHFFTHVSNIIVAPIFSFSQITIPFGSHLRLRPFSNMLSWRAHLFFWALALASLPVAILRERFRHVLPGFLGDTLIENVLPVLAFTAMFSPLRGMRWTYCLCLGCLCVASHDMASGIGFVGRMPSGMAEMDQEGKRMMVAQVLAAFMVLGFLEPLRRNVSAPSKGTG